MGRYILKRLMLLLPTLLGIILINFIIAAILTPTPDIVNQMMMGVPLLILYEVSVLSVWVFGRKTFSGFDRKAIEMDE